jgi:hypothetical protein
MPARLRSWETRNEREEEEAWGPWRVGLRGAVQSHWDSEAWVETVHREQGLNAEGVCVNTRRSPAHGRA